MRVRGKRFLGVLLAICVCLSMLLSVKMPVSAAYENTHKNTGNQAFDIVAVAQTQLGYTEGTNKNNKYGSAFGANNLDWCAFFVSWCAKEAGISTSIIRRQGIASPFSKYFNIPNTHGKNEDYFPKPGDLVFFATNGGSHYHVGIVETVNKSTGKITTIEGNSYQKSSESNDPHYVCRHTMSYNASNICCYGTPNYTGTTLPTEHACDYSKFAYYGSAHPHYHYYECSICGKINCNTSERTSLIETCSDCFMHDALSSCDYGSYVYYESAHPHYNCYACSTCGKVSRNTVEKNYIPDSCAECVNHTCDYGSYVYYEATHPHYNCYTCSLCGKVSRNTSEVNYVPESCDECLKLGKPVLRNMKPNYANGEEIIFEWEKEEDAILYVIQVYTKNAQNEWERTIYATFWPSDASSYIKTLPVGEYRCSLTVHCSNPTDPDGSMLNAVSDDYYFSVVPSEVLPGKPVLNNMKSSYEEGEEIIFEWEATENTLDYVLMLYTKNAQNEWKIYNIHAVTLPRYTRTLPVGEYRCYVRSRNVDPSVPDTSNNSVYTDSDYYYFTVTEPEYIGSINLRGTITSFGVADGEVTVRLMRGDEEVAKAESTNETYSLESITSGEYTMVISKKNHVTRTYSLTVADEDITLDAKIHLIGDVDGNGKVNVGDVSKVNSHLKGSNKITDAYMLLCANVNGGSLNMGDTAALYGHIKGTRKLY